MLSWSPAYSTKKTQNAIRPRRRLLVSRPISEKNVKQRRIQDLKRGGLSLPSHSPPPSPHLPSPPLSSLFPPSLPFPSYPFPIHILFPPSPPLRSRTPWFRLGCLGEHYKLPSGSGQSPAAKRFLVHFQPIWAHIGMHFQATCP